MSNKQTFNHNPNQSSVEWLIGEIIRYQMTFYGTSSMPLWIIEQAKAMHKEEIINANFDGQRLHAKSVTNLMMEDNAEQYYNEIFGGNKCQETK